eukprot:jgi/Tetstr1/429598/TSEL_019497.t1
MASNESPKPQPSGSAAASGAAGSVGCPPHVLDAIYGTSTAKKKEAYEASLKNWWTEYADRKNDEEDEHVADTLLYDKNHLPRTALAPECVNQQPK